MPTAPRALPRSRALLALLALAAAHLALASTLSVPGVWSIDEVVLQLQARGSAAGTPLEVWNGWVETPSPELEVRTDNGPWTVGRNGALRAQYPFLFPLLASPAYPALGLGSLQLVNSLAWAGTLLLLPVLVRRFTDAPAPPIIAVALWVGATPSWSFALGAWPHATSTFAVVAASVLLTGAKGSTRLPATAALAAGACAGLGLLVRLDTLFLAAALALPLLLRAPRDLRGVVAFSAGFLPALAALSAANLIKYGTWWPFTSGAPAAQSSSASFYLRFGPAAALLGGLLLLHLVGPRHRRKLLGSFAGLLLVALLWPTIRAALGDAVRGTVALLTTLSLLPPVGLVEPMLGCFREGDVHHICPVIDAERGGWFPGPKKALLQSCPWLPVLAVGFAPRSGAVSRWTWAPLLLVPAMLLAVFGPSGWHGGLSLQLRYFTPALPFLAVAGALALGRLAQERAELAWAAWLAVAIGVAIALGFEPGARPIPRSVALHHHAPLLLAALVALVVLAWRLRPLPATRRLVLALTAAAAGLAGGLALGQDVPLERQMRASNLAVSDAVASLIPPDSLVFGESIEPLAGLLDVEGVRIATPSLDRYADMARLTRVNREAGRAVYGAFSRDHWAWMAEQGGLEPFELGAPRPLPRDWLLVEMAVKPRPAPPPP